MMQEICPAFNTNRMVYEYNQRFYQPLMRRSRELSADGFAMARSLAAWKGKVYQGWRSIKINYVKNNDGEEQKVGNFFEVEAGITLGSLSPDDVSVELYNGMVDGEESFFSGQPIAMTLKGAEAAQHVFICRVPCQKSGLHGYTLRILPKNATLFNPYELGLIKWEE